MSNTGKNSTAHITAAYAFKHIALPPPNSPWGDCFISIVGWDLRTPGAWLVEFPSEGEVYEN